MYRIFFCACLWIGIFSLNATAQNVNCKKFRNGTFKMDYNGKKGIVKRNGDVQEEFLNGSGTPTFSFKVKWLNDCTYTLDPTATTRKDHPDIPKDATMTVHITKTTANSYSYTARYAFDKKNVYESELILIK
jgi:hypothetical protein